MSWVIALPRITPLYEHGGMDAFPSDHSTVSFALATYMFFYKRVFGYILFVLAGIVALSRVIASVHWPIYILAGAFIGILVAVCIHTLIVKYLDRK
ncbi:MAG: phosphatase PAP2 family protein [Candidatus Paceibacterota bacterium]